MAIARYAIPRYAEARYAGMIEEPVPVPIAAGYCLYARNSDACGGDCLRHIYPGSRARTLLSVYQGETLADPPQLVCLLQSPTGIYSRHVYGEDAAFVRDEAGKYHFDFLADQGGTWRYRFETGGRGATEGEREVEMSAFDEVEMEALAF